MERLVLLLPLLFLLAEARWCAHDKKGICEVPNIGGWCFHDKKTAEFSCDEDNYCRNQSTLAGKTNVAGCFTKNGDIRCCCNVGQLCNPQLVFQQPEIRSTSGQKCSYLYEDPREETVIYKDCQEKWCMAFMHNIPEKGSPILVHRGCESRFLLKHVQSKEMDSEYKNNSMWRSTEVVFNHPRCSEIVNDSVAWVNETQRQCLDIDYKGPDGEPLKGKICCCRGTDNCNADFKWKDPAIRLDTVWPTGPKNGALSVPTVSTMCVVFAAFAVSLGFV